MEIFDVFNGDADGICALLQMRLADPQKSTLITGVKRDIQLLSRVQASRDDQVNVFDISMEKNHSDLIRLLNNEVDVFYVDHHRSGEIPNHPRLKAQIDTSPETCTSLLVNQHLGGRFHAWAITAAFGDNMTRSAEAAGRRFHYPEEQLTQLRALGICLNYNGYGETVSDLHVAPDQLFRALLAYQDPIDFVNDPDSCYEMLLNGYEQDLRQACRMKADFLSESLDVYILPDQAWARRVSGVFGNQLTNSEQEKAHAVLTLNQHGGYVVSVRAPLVNRTKADELCSQFPSGGGRAAAAGINHLPIDLYENFIAAAQKIYG